MGYLREKVFARDKGICTECGLDTEAEWKRTSLFGGSAGGRFWRNGGCGAGSAGTSGTPITSFRWRRGAENATYRTSAHSV